MRGEGETPVNYTHEKPTVPGWYWWRANDSAPAVVIELRNPPQDDPDGTLYAHFRTSYNKTFDGPCAVLSGEFAGPIPGPGEFPFTREEIESALNEAVHGDQVTLAWSLLDRMRKNPYVR